MPDPVPLPLSPSVPAPPHVGASLVQPPLRELLSTDLLQGAREVLIRHGAEVYRLQLTRNGKLILQK